MTPQVRAKLNFLLGHTKVAISPRGIGKGVGMAGKFLKSPKVLAPAALGAGALGMHAVDTTGQQQLAANREAAEVRAVLEQYPELLNVGLTEQGSAGYNPYTGGADSYGQYPGGY